MRNADDYKFRLLDHRVLSLAIVDLPSLRYLVELLTCLPWELLCAMFLTNAWHDLHISSTGEDVKCESEQFQLRTFGSYCSHLGFVDSTAMR